MGGLMDEDFDKKGRENAISLLYIPILTPPNTHFA